MSAKPRKPKHVRQPATAKKRVNISELARTHGISRESLRQWRRDGVDLASPGQLAERIARMHTTGGAGEAMKQARLKKLRAEASLAELELAKRRTQVIDCDTVERLFTNLTLAIVGTYKRLPTEIPNILEGMAPPAMRVRMLDFRDELMADATSRVEAVFRELELKGPPSTP